VPGLLLSAEDAQAMPPNIRVAIFVDLQVQYDWVLEPVLRYSSVDRL
jgi:hypothetical protein